MNNSISPRLASFLAATILFAAGCGGHEETTSMIGGDETPVNLLFTPTSDTNLFSNTFQWPAMATGRTIFRGLYRSALSGQLLTDGDDSSQALVIFFSGDKDQGLTVGETSSIVSPKDESRFLLEQIDYTSFETRSWVANRGTMTILDYRAGRSVTVGLHLEMVPEVVRYGPGNDAKGEFTLEGTYRIDLTNQG